MTRSHEASPCRDAYRTADRHSPAALVGAGVTMVGVDELVDAATYEALAGVSKSDYERRPRDEVGLCELGRRLCLTTLRIRR